MKRTVKLTLLVCLVLITSVFMLTACDNKPKWLPTFHVEAIDPAIAPTCDSYGFTEGKYCAVCGEVFKKQEFIPAIGHTAVIDNGIAPTCTEEGLTSGAHCSACVEILTKQEILPALGHTEVVDLAVPPTATTNGLTEGKHCSVCKEILVKQEIVSATASIGSIGLAYIVNPDNKTCAITGIGGCTDSNVVIPCEINGYTVTEIKDMAFFMCTSILSVTISDTVKTIGVSAFEYCFNLVSVYVPSRATLPSLHPQNNYCTL